MTAALFTRKWRIDRTSSVPAYAQIEERLVDLIESGRLTVGDRVPSERELARWVGVSRLTTRAALASLARRGLLERGVGRRGTVVARAKLVHDLTEFAGFTDMVSRHGLSATARIRAANDLAANEIVAGELGLALGDPVYRIERLRFADDEPLTLEDSWIPARRFPGLLDQDLRGSLYRLMRDVYECPPVRAVERLEPTVAETHQAQALGVAPGTPLMLVVRVAYSADGAPVELARDHHRGDRAQFVVEVPTTIDERSAAHISARSSHSSSRGSLAA
jgi:GntR family transcriptional regulator